MAGDLTGRHVKKVAELIGVKWQDLGIKLGIPYNDLQDLATPATGGPSQYAARMLNRWNDENADMPATEVRDELIDALGECGRNDVAAIVEDKLHTENNIESVFQEISELLIRDWKDVGYCLNIESHKLDAASKPQPLEENPKLQMLEKWRKGSARGGQRDQLIKALRELRREDIVKAIEEVDRKTKPRIPPTQGDSLVAQPSESQPPPRGANTCTLFDQSGPSQDQHDSGALPQSEEVDRINGLRIPPTEGNSMVAQPSESQPQPGGASACTLFDQAGGSQDQHDSGALPQSDERPNMATVGDLGQQPPPVVLNDATFSILSGDTTPEDEVADVSMIHDTPSVSDKTSERLNPKYEWMGLEFRRLRDAVNTPIRPVVIALLDSGVNTYHPELKDFIIASKYFTGVKRNGQLIPHPQEEDDLRRDFMNHGTVSAGILRQYAGNKNIRVLNLKVLKSNGAGSLRYVSRALEYIKQWDKEKPELAVDIVVMTLGNPKDDAETNRHLAALGEDKVLVCSAANEGERRADSILSPAKHGSVIAIGSCNKTGNRCDHSAVGAQLAFLFPGMDIWSTSSGYTPSDETTRYINREGTSFAAPHCAALVAVILLFVEKELNGFLEKSGAHWRKTLTNSSKMKELLRDFCHRQHSPENGYGVPELDRITKNRIEDFIKRNC